MLVTILLSLCCKFISFELPSYAEKGSDADALEAIAINKVNSKGQKLVLRLRQSNREKKIKGQLELKLRNGSITIEDKFTAEDSTTRYLFLDLLPQGFYLLSIRYYEGTDFLMIDKSTGQQIIVCGEPHFSSDGFKFYANAVDLVAEYTATKFELFEYNKSQKIWTKSFEKGDSENPFPVDNIKWVTNNKISMSRIDKVLAANPPFRKTEVAKGFVEYKNGNWNYIEK